ncbi:MAG: monofunctional biosynthetic peptidoglycan transglycosylase [Pseudorhodobacter sp.]|nr:monofunctional biosynthetic peptidoglycan transglycosylase [Pseudorhodobacter sp.]
MALKTTRRKSGGRPAKRGRPQRSLGQRLRRGLLWGAAGVAGFFGALVLLFAVLNPPTTIYMLQEGSRLGKVQQTWAGWDKIAPVMARSVVAAEDADFCLHWGFDMRAIRAAVAEGGNRGASTISQQVVKNVFLWQGRNWLRKAMEAVLTPVVELVWSKRRILEVYLNVAEFGEGLFGVEAAAQHYFGTTAAQLTPVQAARLASVLPDPKGRDAAQPGSFVRRKSAQVAAGAETIRLDGRAACFEQ